MDKLVFCLLIYLSLNFQVTYGQGCSDAGFCSMGAMKPDQSFNKEAKLHLRFLRLEQY